MHRKLDSPKGPREHDLHTHTHIHVGQSFCYNLRKWSKYTAPSFESTKSDNIRNWFWVIFHAFTKKLAIFRLRFDIVSVDERENRGDHLPSAILTDKCFVVPFLIIVELFILPSVLFCRTCKFCCWIAVVLAQTLLLFAGEIAAIVIELLLASLFSATQIEKKKVSKGEISFNWLFYILFVFSMENSRQREFSYFVWQLLGAAKNKIRYSMETGLEANGGLKNMRFTI